MPDARVQSAIDNWASRLISNGVDFNDFVRTTGAIERWEDWLDAWTATADVHRGLAEQQLADGHRRSAGIGQRQIDKDHGAPPRPQPRPCTTRMRCWTPAPSGSRLNSTGASR